MKFPNFYKAISKDDLRYEKHGAALIQDGKIVLITGHFIVYSDFGAFASNPELAHERLLDRDLLKWMAGANVKSLQCTHSDIIATFKDGTTETRCYSGHIDTDNGFQRISLHGEYNGETFPFWKNSMPTQKEYQKAQGTNILAITPVLLEKIMGCFSYGKDDYLICTIISSLKPIHITVMQRFGDNNFSQCAILMPVDLTKESKP